MFLVVWEIIICQDRPWTHIIIERLRQECLRCAGFDHHLSSDYAGGSGEGGCWPNADEKCIVTIADAIAVVRRRVTFFCAILP